MNRFRFFLLGSLSLLAGCHGTDKVERAQSDEDAETPRVQTIGNVAEFGTPGSVPISGVGLVVDLPGTGGGAPAGEFRTMLEQYLKKLKIDNPKDWIDSPNNAMVLVNGEMPVGSRRGDAINVEITLPPGSKARSLRGGYLLETPMMSYSSQAQVRSYMERNSDTKSMSAGDGLLKGHTLAMAEGPLQMVIKDTAGPIVHATDKGPDGKSVKTAWVWKGAQVKVDQPLFVVMNSEHQRDRKADIVASRINETFHGPGEMDKIAAQKSKDTLVLNAPPQFRANNAHFLRVIRMIPEFRIEENSEYTRKMEEQLNQPETTLSAAIRLEALGRPSIPILRYSLKNSPYPLVRFASAEALAYLGEPICANELGKLAADHPSLAAHCLTALASLDEAASVFALQDLLGVESPEIRYGAFRALREVDPRGEASRGHKVNKTFWLHVAASDSKPLIHLLTHDRAEFVVFGKTPQLGGAVLARGRTGLHCHGQTRRQ